MPGEAGREWSRGVRRVAQPRERTGAGAMRGATAGVSTGDVSMGADLWILDVSSLGSCHLAPTGDFVLDVSDLTGGDALG